MASETTTGSNIDIVWEYTERVFNQHSPDLAAKYRVRWDAVDIYRLAARLQGQPTRTEPGDQDRGSRPGQSQRRSRCNRRGTDQLRRPRLQACFGAEVDVAS
jgi:hypothetical protein